MKLTYIGGARKAPGPKATRQKITEYVKQISSMVEERTDLVEGLAKAAILGLDIALIGPPGKTKTGLVKLFSQGVQDSSFFSHYMNKHTRPEEILGPIDIEAFRKGKIKYVVKGKMPDCEFVVLEEGFEGSSATLNALLGILADRERYEEGIAYPVACEVVVVCSNKVPEQGSGLWDRFSIRFFTDDISDQAIRRMIDADEGKDWRRRHQSHNEKISFDDFRLAAVYAADVKISDAAWAAFFKVIDSLRKERVDTLVSSDRRKKYAARWLRLTAWLRGSSTVSAVDIKTLLPLAWGCPEEIAKVKTVLGEVRDPTVEIQQLQRDYIDTRRKFREHCSEPMNNHTRKTLFKAYRKTMSMYCSTLRDITKELKSFGYAKNSDDMTILRTLLRKCTTEATVRDNGHYPNDLPSGLARLTNKGGKLTRQQILDEVQSGLLTDDDMTDDDMTDDELTNLFEELSQ